MKRHANRADEQKDQMVQIALDRRVLEFITAELQKFPLVEEGGKYVGYLLPPSSPKLRDLGLKSDVPALVVTDFLPSGPNAVRTAVELQPDGEYQESLFRRIERIDPDVEHLGTWHSHHCNGLRTLSEGDITGYGRTVNNRAYRPNYFFASLVTRLPRGPKDSDWIDHYVFVRGRDQYYRITESVVIVESPTVFGGVVEHPRRAGVTENPRHETKRPTPPSDKWTNLTWYDTQEGRKTLATDRQFFALLFKDKVVVTRSGVAITMTGKLNGTAVSITYPSDSGDSLCVTVALNRGAAAILKINASLQWRQLAVKATVAAAQELAVDPSSD